MLLTHVLLSKLPLFLKLHNAVSCFFHHCLSLTFLALHWILSLTYWVPVIKDKTHGKLQPTRLVYGLQTESMCTVASNRTFRDRFYWLIIVCWIDWSLVIKLQVLADMINRDVSCCYFCCQVIWMQALLVNSQGWYCNNPKRDRTGSAEGRIHMAYNWSCQLANVLPGPLLICCHVVIFLSFYIFWTFGIH